MAKKARIFVVRHGETDANVQKIIQGHLNTRLNSTGKRQAEMVAEALRDVPFVAAFTSDLARASETAQTILRFHPEVKLVEQEALRERYMGELEGRTWPTPAGVLAPSMEKAAEVAARSIKWWKDTVLKSVASLPEPANPSDPLPCVLAVSHGGFIGTLGVGLVGARHVRCADEVKVGGHIPNTGIFEVEIEGQKGVALRFADEAHLTVLKEEARDGESHLALPADDSNADALVA